MNEKNQKAEPSEDIKKAILGIRALPPESSRFTLFAAIEPKNGRRWQTTVVNRGRGPDSRYYAVQTPDGLPPEWAPAESTYAGKTEEELLAILNLFLNNPGLFSKEPGDALDEAFVEPYEDDEEE